MLIVLIHVALIDILDPAGERSIRSHRACKSFLHQSQIYSWKPEVYIDCFVSLTLNQTKPFLF